MLNIVLVEPEIPQNTGNIARTCAATGCPLHLIRPLGFAVTDKHLKRSGMDYWEDVQVIFWDDFAHFARANPADQVPWILATTKASRTYDQAAYPEGAFLLFGPESRGLPEDLIRSRPQDSVRIPMVSQARSLNLSNAVAVMAYHGLKTQGFPGLQTQGFLPD